MTMLARKILIDSHLKRIVNCQVIRTVRGSIKIPVHLEERMSKNIRNPEEKYLEDVPESNIGIGHSLRAHLEYYGKDIDDEFDPEAIHEDLDLDDIHSKIKDLSANLKKKENVKHFLTIKKKYFRPERIPGMLTYAEKQQIIHLNQEDPDYWNEYKLAEGFPATPEIIKKILKVKFVAYTVNQILRHDEIVRKNWEAFEKGELKFSDELQKKYSSYIGRSRLVTDAKEMEKFIPPPPDFAANISVKEFSSIIESSEKHQLEVEKKKKQVDVDDQGKFVYHMQQGQADIIDESAPTKSNLKHETLDTFRMKIAAGKKNKSLVDHIIVEAEPVKQIEEVPINEYTIAEQKEERHDPDVRSTTGVISKDFNPFMAYKKDLDYPMRINIPSKLWQKNKLYRYRDCFYDHTGVFLYRVPGLQRF